ncbi:MAG: hypothetical protein IJ587_07975 [Synergistaceae bacterium]|nr:hypothetical protein [Synergistaceae bacterium]
MKAKFFTAAVLAFLYFLPANAEYSSDDLLRMTVESLSYDVGSDRAFVCGVGKISGNDPIGTYSARRTALTDAQRGLLILKRSIKEGRPPKIQNVSGFVPPLKILSEKIMNGLYFIEAEVSLSELMNLEDREPKIDRIFHGTEYEF